MPDLSAGAPKPWEYQYNLKDIWNNTRLTFTTKNELDSATATLETSNIASEQSEFLRLETARKVYSALFDHTNGSTLGYSERLNGTANEKFGIAKSLSVMPGDTLKLEVYAKYVDTNNGNWTQALTDFLAAIANGTAPAGTVVDGAGYSTSTSSFSYAGLLNTSGSTGNGPKAYLNWLIFDRDINFINGGYKRLSDIAKEQGQNVAHEKLSAIVPITQAGFVYVYLSNEETSPVEVYFDDMMVTHVKSPIIGVDDYTPFGMTFNSYTREGSLENKIKFQGQERITDLDLGWDSFRFRNYMPDIGRFFNVDPLADKYVYNSPYAFAENKLGMGTELEGLELNPFKNEINKVERVVMPVVNGTIEALQRGVDKVSNMFSLGDDRGGFVVTGTGMASHPLPGVRGQVDDNSLVDLDASILDVPNFGATQKGLVKTFIGKIGEFASAADNAGDLRDAAEGSGIGVWAPKQETQTIENVVSYSKEFNTIEVTKVNDTIFHEKNHSMYDVTLKSGKDSIIQVANYREKKEKDEK